MFYYRLCKGLKDNGTLIPETHDVYDYVPLTNKKDSYLSIFKYNEEQYKTFQETESVAGIVDVIGNKLVWDFDNADPELSKKDALELISRLKKHQIPEEDIQVYFSGNKGFHIIVDIEDNITPTQLRRLNTKLAEGLITNDTSICNASRILRVAYSVHNKTNLYKIGMFVHDLEQNSLEDIKKVAESLDNIPEYPLYNNAKLPISLINIMKSEPKVEPIKLENGATLRDLDFSKRPKFLDEPRWALQNGYFEEGDRSSAFLCLAATYKNMGYDVEHTYRLLKGVAALQVKKFGGHRFPDSELYNNICTQVYGPMWKGGQYTTKDPGSWLHQYSKKWNIDISNKDNTIISTDGAFNLFQNYAYNFEKNALKTGIQSLDRNCSLMVGTSNAVLAAPGVGKSSLAFNVLAHNSKAGNRCIFFSYDMFHAAVITRLIQRQTGFNQESIYNITKNDPKKLASIKDRLKEEFKNVDFCFKSGQTADEIEQTISETEEKHGEKVKLIIVDYNELVASGISDPTQASAQTAQRFRQIANDRELCSLVLLQPSKLYSNINDEASSYNAAKGSSAIAQSLTLMLSLSRPGFSPRAPENDKYMTVNALKHRNGRVFTSDLHWDGLRGTITELDDGGKEELAILREQNEQNRRTRDQWR